MSDNPLVEPRGLSFRRHAENFMLILLKWAGGYYLMY